VSTEHLRAHFPSQMVLGSVRFMIDPCNGGTFAHPVHSRAIPTAVGTLTTSNPLNVRHVRPLDHAHGP
jgi:hypothetical protein